MSFAPDRGVFGSALGGVGRLGFGSLGSRGAPLRLQGPLCGSSSSFQCPHPSSQLLPVVHQGSCPVGGCPGPVGQRGHRACSINPGLLQPAFCHPQGHRGLEAGDRPVRAEPVGPTDQVPYGDSTVCVAVSPRRGLDVFGGLAGCLPAGPCPSGLTMFPSLLCSRSGLSVHLSLLRPLHSSTGVYPGHGPCLFHPPSTWLQDPALPGRLARPGFLPRPACPGEGLSPDSLLQPRDPGEPRQELPLSISVPGIPRDASPDPPFEGFPDGQTSEQAQVAARRISVLSAAASDHLEAAARGHVVPGLHRSRGAAAHAFAPAALRDLRPSSSGVLPCSLGRLLPRGSSVVVRRGTSSRRPPPGSFHSGSFPVHGRLGLGLGRSPRRRASLRCVASREFTLFHQSPGVAGSLFGGCRVPSPAPRPVCLAVRRQHHGFGLPEESGGHSFVRPERCGASCPPLVRGPFHPPGSPVHPGAPQRSCGLSEQAVPGSGLRVDAVLPGLQGDPSSLAGDDRSLRHLDERSPPGVLLTDSGSHVGGHGCDGAVLGRASGLRLPSLWSSPLRPREGSAVSGAGAHVGGSLLASAPVVPGPSGASGGCSGGPSTSEGSTQTATLPSLSPEPPRASADFVQTFQRSARAFGFSSRVARQLARCRRTSTILNYQAKWSVYRAWCQRHGHSVSRPSVSKVADFLLYLHRSLGMAFSTVSSYRSMLSSVFRFSLPELSSHFVLAALLRSFRLERPRLSSRVPPWDLSLVLASLRGPPFEPLTTCSLRDLTRKVLFLLSLATARRVGELQALSASVSFSGDDIFLSYLPEFRAKTDTAARPLPRSFPVRSLRDFVGSLPEELLLCPVRALRVYLDRTSSLSPRPRSLFVSPRAPSRSLSKNALSFFLRDVISSAYSSSGRSLPSLAPSSAPSSSSSSAPSSGAGGGAVSGRRGSAVRAHSIRGVSSSWAFLRNASISSVLEAATWASPSVFSSFYLSDVQFSSSSGFSLGPVVAAGSVV